MRTLRLVVAVAITAAISAIMLFQLTGIAHAGKIDPTLDPDNDGCTTSEELGSDPALGGLRDPDNPNDFFDTPPRDNAVSIVDVLRIVARFGTTAGASNYSEAFDRSPPPPGGALWALGPPNGSITISDILASVFQFGHHCGELQGGWCQGDVKDITLFNTEPIDELEVGESWRDCFEYYDAQGNMVGYLTRGAEGEVTSEEITEEEAQALGYSLPDGFTGGPGAAAALPPWRSWVCEWRYWTEGGAGNDVNVLHIRQRWVTTPFTNIAWPPPDGEAWAESHWGWHLADAPDPSPSPYAIAYYSPGIVARAETHATSYHEFTVSATFFGFGGSVTIASQRIHGYLKFKYKDVYSQPPPPNNWDCRGRATTD